jgi:hypothetical protein
MKHPLLVLAVVLGASRACPASDSDDVADTDATETATSDATETETGTEDETETETETGDPQDDLPVQCEDLTCAEGELCVEPAAWCDYTQDPVTWVYPDAVCLPFPSECEDLQDDPLLDCLWMTVCESKGENSESLQFEMGAVDCPPAGLDCFGDPTS